MEKRIKYGTILLIFLITSLLVYGYFSHMSGGRFPPLNADSKAFARDLISLADSSESSFDQKYLYKILSVRGVVRDIKRNKAGNYTLSLAGNPGEASSINCSLDSLYKHHALPLIIGDSCSIRGTCAGHLLDIILLECIIEK